MTKMRTAARPAPAARDMRSTEETEYASSRFSSFDASFAVSDIVLHKFSEADACDAPARDHAGLRLLELHYEYEYE
jgi:hypothetical protein